eukprot:13824685-Ditylum_brightwellii.AAC.1
MRALQCEQEQNADVCASEKDAAEDDNNNHDVKSMPMGLAFYLVQLLQKAYDDWIQSIVDGIISHAAMYEEQEK